MLTLISLVLTVCCAWDTHRALSSSLNLCVTTMDIFLISKKLRLRNVPLASLKVEEGLALSAVTLDTDCTESSCCAAEVCFRLRSRDTVNYRSGVHGLYWPMRLRNLFPSLAAKNDGGLEPTAEFWDRFPGQKEPSFSEMVYSPRGSWNSPIGLIGV